MTTWSDVSMLTFEIGLCTGAVIMLFLLLAWDVVRAAWTARRRRDA